MQDRNVAQCAKGEGGVLKSAAAAKDRASILWHTCGIKHKAPCCRNCPIPRFAKMKTT